MTLDLGQLVEAVREEWSYLEGRTRAAPPMEQSAAIRPA